MNKTDTPKLYAISRQVEPEASFYSVFQYIFCTEDQVEELRKKLPEPVYKIDEF